MSITLDQFDMGWDSFSKLQNLYLTIKKNMDSLTIQHGKNCIDELDLVMKDNDQWENLVLQLFSLREDLRNKRDISIHQVDVLENLANEVFPEC